MVPLVALLQLAVRGEHMLAVTLQPQVAARLVPMALLAGLELMVRPESLAQAMAEVEAVTPQEEILAESAEQAVRHQAEAQVGVVLILVQVVQAD